MSDSFNPDKYLKSKAGASFDPDTYLKKKSPSSDTSKLESGLLGLAQGATFNFADEGVAGIEAAYDALTSDETLKNSYQKNLEEQRKMYDEAKEANPASYLTGEIGGGVASAFIPGVGAIGNVGRVAKGAGLATKIGAGVLGGATQGALSSVGASEETDVPGLAVDALTGGLVGGSLGAALPIAGAGVSPLASGTKNVARAGADYLGSHLGKVEDLLSAYDLRKAGVKVIGKEAEQAVKKETSETLDNLVRELKKSVGKDSEVIGAAIKDVKAGKISTADFLNEIEDGISKKEIPEGAIRSAINKVKAELSTTEKIKDVEGAMAAAKNWQTEQQDLFPDITVKDPYVAKSGENVIAELEKPGSLKEKVKALQVEVPEIDGELLPESALARAKKLLGKGKLKSELLEEQSYPSKLSMATADDGTKYVQNIVTTLQEAEPKEAKKLFKVLEKEVVKAADDLSTNDAYDLYKKLRDSANKARGAGGENYLDNLANSLLVKIEKALPEKSREALSTGRVQMATKIGQLEQMPKFKDLSDWLSRKETSGFVEPVEEVLTKGKIGQDLFGDSDHNKTQREAVSKLEELLTGKQDYSKKLEELNTRDRLLNLSNRDSNLGQDSFSLTGLAKSVLPKASIPGYAGNFAGWTATLKDSPMGKLIKSVSDILDGPTKNVAIRELAKYANIPESEAIELVSQYKTDEISIPDSGIAKKKDYESEYDTIDPIEFLEASEGSAETALPGNVKVPGKTGSYDDGKGNITHGPFGANQNSLTTKKAYKDLGLDINNSTYDEHAKAARYNWQLHRKTMQQSLDNKKVNLDAVPQEKKALVDFLLTDLVYNGGLAPINSSSGAKMLDSIKQGDIPSFVQQYQRFIMAKPGAGPRKSEIIKVLKQL